MRFLIFILAVFSHFCFATVNVAFIKAYDNQGELIRLERGGQFFHVAIQIEDGRWLHSHPKFGVQLVDHLSAISPTATILANKNMASIPFSRIAHYIGLPFDYKYRWDDERSTYCAKLIGQILEIAPEPMDFTAEHWRIRGRDVSNGVGLSPDDIYKSLGRRGFKEVINPSSCEGALGNSPFVNMLREQK